MIIVVLRPFTCPVMNFITVMNVNRDPCVDYWVIRNPNIATIDAQWEGMGDVGSARYEPALLPPCPTNRVLSYSN